jgi:hypothetical protein
MMCLPSTLANVGHLLSVTQPRQVAGLHHKLAAVEQVGTINADVLTGDGKQHELPTTHHQPLSALHQAFDSLGIENCGLRVEGRHRRAPTHERHSVLMFESRPSSVTLRVTILLWHAPRDDPVVARSA